MATITSVSTEQSYTAMYNAIAGQLGMGKKNFQLIYPMQSWNWTVGNPGQTPSAQQSFLDAMPSYSPVGAYQSGSSFAQSYRAWLNALVVAADAQLANQITQQQQVLQTAVNKYQMDLSAAQAAYNKAVPSQSPSFRDWLADPYGGAGYKTTLDGDTANMNKQQQILNQLIAQADDKQIDQANQEFANSAYRTQVVSSSLQNPVSEPGYGQITDYATWVQQNAGNNSATISWQQGSNTSSFQSNWAKASASYTNWWWSVSVGGQWQEIKTSGSNASLRVQITFNAWGAVPVSPMGWYDEGVVKAKINNPQAYRSGYSVTEPAGGTGAWVLGQGGILPCRITDFLVCYQPEISISISAGFTQTEQTSLQAATGVRFGPFSFGGSGGTSSDFQLKQSSSTQFTAKDNSKFPKIFGVYVEDFSQA